MNTKMSAKRSVTVIRDLERFSRYFPEGMPVLSTGYKGLVDLTPPRALIRKQQEKDTVNKQAS
jgi:hypothetical protein